MASESAVRFSQGKKDIGAAKNFSWEHPVPENAFWADLEFTTGRNFLQSFSPEEVEALPINPESTDDKPTKLKLLLKLLQEKLAAEDAAAAPQTFYDVNFEAWDQLWLGIYTLQDQLGAPEAGATIRMLADRRKNKANLSHLHTLAAALLKEGQYAEAEATALPVLEWLDEKLGKDSPQSMGSRRMLIEAIWKQGPERRAEAEALFTDMMSIMENSGDSPFSVYHDENRELGNQLITELRGEESSKQLTGQLVGPSTPQS